MTKKIIACFVAALIILIPLQTNAEELQGTVTSLSLDEKAPYAGVLLDPIAASKMLVDQRYLRIEIELQLRKEFQKEDNQIDTENMIDSEVDKALEMMQDDSVDFFK